MNAIKPLATVFALAALPLFVSCNEQQERNEGDHSEHNHAAHDHDHSGHGHSHSHDHGDHSNCNHGVKSGPNGGRMLEKVSPNAEFLVDSDKRIKITFYNEQLSAVMPSVDSITATFGELGRLSTQNFIFQGTYYLSEAPIPESEKQPVAVVIKLDGKKSVEKFILDLEQCKSCNNKEYACTCEHDH